MRCTLFLLRTVLVGALFAAVTATASIAQADSTFSDFRLEENFQLKIDGVADPKAEIYRNRLPAFLILSRSLPDPVLVVPRGASVQKVNLMKISKQDTGAIDLLADAALERLGSIEIDGTGIRFSAFDKAMELGEKPPLLGDQTIAGLTGYSENYQTLMDAYKPNAESLAALRQEKGITAVIYFGTWCPFCGRYVPRMMQVANQLGDSGAQIEFYGLPGQISNDARAKAAKVNGVPTGIVYRDGKEIGRLEGDAWTSPERSLLKVIRGD